MVWIEYNWGDILVDFRKVQFTCNEVWLSFFCDMFWRPTTVNKYPCIWKKWNWETEQERRDNQRYFHFYVKVFLFTRFNKISLKVYVALEYLIDFVNSILISTVSYNKVLVIKVFVIYFVQYSVCCINSCNARFHFRSSFPFNLSKKISRCLKVSMCHKLAIKLLLRIL